MTRDAYPSLVLSSGFQSAVAQTLYYGSLPDWQLTPLNMIYSEAKARHRSVYDTAYAMATGHHETGRWRYLEEIGHGSGRPYGIPINLKAGKTVTYHGRGWVHITWLGNYARFVLPLGMDIVSNPDLVLEPRVACFIMWEGMVHGMFTGHSFNTHTDENGVLNYKEARRIINGTDKASLIAEYAEKFEAALRTGGDF